MPHSLQHISPNCLYFDIHLTFLNIPIFTMGILPLTYTRPKHVDQETYQSSRDSLSDAEKSDTSLKSGRSGNSAGIPDSLSFDKIVSGGTCPVCIRSLSSCIYVLVGSNTPSSP